MTFADRDGGEVAALITDRYLDTLLAGVSWPSPAAVDPRGRRQPDIDGAVRAASRRLAGDLPRFHPSFRFEERLAVRLAEAAAAMRLPIAAGAEAGLPAIASLPTGATPRQQAPTPLRFGDDEGFTAVVSRPILVRGAVAASALSLAGAAWLAWRRRPPASAMARAARAAHAARPQRLV